MNELTNYVKEYALVLIPMLYVIGMILKGIDSIKDKYIPLLLLVVGISGSIGLNGVSMDSIIQGILVTGVTVYTNQLVVQSKKDNTSSEDATLNKPTSNTLVTDSANSKMRVDNPENIVSEGNVVNITDTKTI